MDTNMLIDLKITENYLLLSSIKLLVELYKYVLITIIKLPEKSSLIVLL